MVLDWDVKGVVGVVGEMPFGWDWAEEERERCAREEVEFVEAEESGRLWRAVVGVADSGVGSRDSSLMSMFQMRTV